MSATQDRARIGVAWACWIATFALICGDVFRHPLKHTTMPTYRRAVDQWWAGQDIYSFDSHAGFLYFPQAAFLFSPFEFVPFWAGEVVWRAVTFGLFAYALVRLNAIFPAADSARIGRNFLILSLLAIPSAFASLRNAQFDLPLAALVVLTFTEIASQRWTMAAVWLCLAFALKPLALVPMLLFGALYWRLIPRLIVGLVIVILLPFLHWSPAYVAHEYVRCFQTLVWATKADEPKFSELSALISQIGLYPPEWLKTVTRLLFALIYLGLAATAVRRLNRIESAWSVGALSADYLMLFNPRTETCSYVMLGPFVASAALFYGAKNGQKWLGFLLGLAALALAADAIPKVGTFSVNELTDRWLKPLVALLFLPTLAMFIFEKRSRDSTAPMP